MLVAGAGRAVANAATVVSLLEAQAVGNVTSAADPAATAAAASALSGDGNGAPAADVRRFGGILPLARNPSVDAIDLLLQSLDEGDTAA